MEECDVAIIGAGPIGIELACALRETSCSVLHFEAGAIGATVRWYAPETRFFSSAERLEIAGVPLLTRGQAKPTREEYLTYLRMVISARGVTVSTFERVVDVHRESDRFLLTTARSFHGVGGPEKVAHIGAGGVPQQTLRRVSAKYVVLAIGGMHQPRELGIPGEDLPHVKHFLSDPHDFFGREVLLVGGKNSAVEAAIRLYRIGASVTMSYRGAGFDKDRIKFWLYPEILGLIRKKAISFYAHTAPVQIDVDTVTLRSTADGANGHTHTVRADDVLLLTGYRQDPTLFRLFGVELNGEAQSPTFDPETMETNVPGVFVAGTASAGTQASGVSEFIETGHIHVDRIFRALTGQLPSFAGGQRTIWAPES